MIQIAVFAFNRPDHLQKTLCALAANELADKSSLTIFCDGPRNEVDEPKTTAVRNVAKNAKGFFSVDLVERSCNMGCAASTIQALTELFKLYEKLIVIEDDDVTSPYALRFLTDGLNKYQDNEKVFNISAWTPPHIARNLPLDYPYDVYAIPRLNSWGWASWRDRFQDIDWNVSDYEQFKNDSQRRNAFNAGGNDLSLMLDMQRAGKIDSWSIRADYARFKKNMVGINPVHSYVFNIGIGSGTHTTTATTYWDSDLAKAVKHPRFLDDVWVDPRIHAIYRSCFNSPRLSFSERLKNKIKKFFKKG